MPRSRTQMSRVKPVMSIRPIPYMRSDVRRKFEEWRQAISLRYEEEWENGDFSIENGGAEWFAHTRRDPEALAFSLAQDLWAR